MSLHDYNCSKQIGNDISFFGIIMAAMWRADSVNAGKLYDMFPEIWDEFEERYRSPGGEIEKD